MHLTLPHPTLPHRPAFRRLLAAYAVSRAGDYLYNVSLLVLVLERTGSLGWVAAVSVVRLVPAVVLAPWGGAVADRFDRVRLVVACSLLASVVLAGLAVAASGPVVLLPVGAFLAVLVTTPSGPALAALLPATVPAEELGRANALLGVAEFGAVTLGPAAAALVLWLGPGWLPFALDAATFLVTAVLVAGLPHGPARRTAAVVGGGWRAVREADLGPVLVCTVASSVLFGCQVVLVAPLSRRLGTGSWGAGVLEAAAGTGGLLLAVVLARHPAAAARHGTLPLAVLVNGAALAAVGLAPSPLLAGGAMAVAGATTLAVDVAGMTLVQAAVDGAVLGRVDGLLRSAAVGGMVAGNAVTGALASLLGLTPVLLLAGAAGVVVALRVVRRPTKDAAALRADAREEPVALRG